MATLFIVFLGLAALHFVYDGIILPTIRLHLRYQIFAIRDDLRRLKIVYKDNLGNEDFHYLQDLANNSIRLLPYINLEILYRARQILTNQKIERKVMERIKRIESCKVADAVQIRIRINRCLGYAFVANSGMWLIYILPLILAAIFYDALKMIIKETVCLPSSEILKIAPPQPSIA